MSAGAPSWQYKSVIAPKFGRFCDSWLNFETQPGDDGNPWDLDRAHALGNDLHLVFSRDLPPAEGMPMPAKPPTQYRICYAPQRDRLDSAWLNGQTRATDDGDAWELHSIVTIENELVCIMFRAGATASGDDAGIGYYSAAEQRPQAWQAQARGASGKFGTKIAERG